MSWFISCLEVDSNGKSRPYCAGIIGKVDLFLGKQELKSWDLDIILSVG